MTSRIKIVGIGGTTRPDSTSERLMALVLDKCRQFGAETQMFGGMQLASLPHYAPETHERTTGQIKLTQAVRDADGLVIATPGYHGGVSALVKNALDLLEDTRKDNRAYLDGCPVGLIVSCAGWQAVGVTLSSLRDIVSALRGWPSPLSVTINSMEQRPFDESGAVIDASLDELAAAQAEQIVSDCRRRAAGGVALFRKAKASQ